MPTELEELVGFLEHGNTQIRSIGRCPNSVATPTPLTRWTACENLVGYSASQPSIFKKDQLLPIKHLVLLVRDYPSIAKNALTILVNLSSQDDEIRARLAQDDDLVIDLVRKITNPKDPSPQLLSELLANLSIHPSLARLRTLTLPATSTSQSDAALDQLLDLFVSTPSDSNYDYLSYLLASLSGTSEDVRKYFLTPQAYDNVTPLSKIFVFTEHPSLIRRRGVAGTLKNACFEVSSHPALLSLPSAETGSAIDILPYILLPLAGSETYPEDEMDKMLPDLQLLPPDKQRESSNDILTTHIESLTLLTTTRKGRDRLREVQVYAIVRECHSHVQDEGVGEAVERLVNVLMRDEAEGEGDAQSALVKRDEDREIEEVF
ncbi:uncharacterized protein HMPREF1541_01181 [Cyphellophora europaea CBS 101466]|uniref:Protein HGH1 homolog n=1 Tax=Cyphellophora europaea (strain CBS 101466) TaxID=1220924 RepID=W2SE40_CYPE1|nr:uncharacterized protein HMPREF1541_01181 [Cyphellophora europaea CBS 101466]ETN46991.1 hypothetical protein HMPREF1541_01181 [Cyphellophora europaea CBS 101466]